MNGEIDRDRYDRSIRALGEDAQRQLADTHVAVVGVGGLGSIITEQLGRYGVHHLTLIDPDHVETSNLPRLYGAYHDDIGRPKVTVVHEHLQRINPDIAVISVQQPVEDARGVLQDADLVVAGVDRISTRIWLNQYAVRNDMPYIDAGVHIATDDGPHVETMEGWVHRIVPGETACFECLDRGDRERARIERLSEAEQEALLEQGYIEETDLAPEPAVIPLNGQVASKTVETAARHITGYAEPADFLHIETTTHVETEASSPPVDGCPVCGTTSDTELDLNTDWAR